MDYGDMSMGMDAGMDTGGADPQDQVLGEISGAMEDMVVERISPDFFENTAEPKHLPEDPDGQQAIEFSDDDMAMLEEAYA